MRDFEPDYYQRLCVGRDADTEEIRAAFRKMAQRYHPDHNSGSEDEFVKIRRAYETLINAALRAEYNHYLDLLAGQDSFIAIKPSVRDLYDDMVGYLKEVIGFRNRAEYELVLKKEIENKEKIVRVAIPVESICRRCLGTGGTIFGECSFCKGRGKYVYEENVDLLIPADSEDGEQMMLTFPTLEVKLILRYR